MYGGRSLWREEDVPMRSAILCVFALLLGAASAHCAPRTPLLGDYNRHLRGSDGRVDNREMIRRLTDLGANTFMWLIWHRPTDWDDLQEFLPMAHEAGISVWVYLVPHSESGPQGEYTFPYSEPYRLDYVRWAEEIARLSLEHENLIGWVIDDFWYNFRKPDGFTEEYTARMVQAARAINPGIKFYPLMYFHQLDIEFVQTLAPLVDGVVVAYPRDRAEIERVLPYLDDRLQVPATVAIVFPPATGSQPGDQGFVSHTVRVRDAVRASVTFRYRDDFSGQTEGYHFMQLRVDGQVVWEEDVAGHDDGEVTVDLSKIAATEEQLHLSFGVYDRQGVTQFPLCARFSIVDLSGLAISRAAQDSFEPWEQQRHGSFSFELLPAYRGTGRHRLPIIVMPAGDRAEYQSRWGVYPTAQMIADKVSMVLELVAEGKVEGVVTYCLDKAEGSEDLDAVGQVYHIFRMQTENALMH